MNNLMLRLLVAFQSRIVADEGQELAETALIVTLVSLAATASLKSFSTGIDHAFTNISSTFASSLS